MITTTKSYLPFTRALSMVAVACVSGLFFLHILANEKNENTFIEYDIHVFILLTATLFAIKGIQLFFQKKNIVLNLNNGSKCALAFVIYIIFQSFFIEEPNEVLLKCILLLTILYFQLLNVFEQRAYINFILSFFLLAVFLTQITLLFNFSIFSFRSYTSPRIIVSGPSACFLAAVFPFVFNLAFSFNGKRKRDYFYFISACTLTMVNIYLLVVSHSRTAWVASILASMLILEHHFRLLASFRQAIQTKPIKIMLILIGAVMMCIAARELYQYNPASVDGRLLIYTISAKMILINPLFGIGAGKFEYLYNLHQAEYFLHHSTTYKTQMLAGDNFFVFNELLHIAIELGIVGLGIFVAILIIVFRTLKKANQIGKKKKTDFLFFGSVASLSSIFICSFSSYPFSILSVSVLAVFYFAIVMSQADVAKIKIPFTFPFNLLIAISMLVVVLQEMERMQALQRWEKAADLALNEKFIQARPMYGQSYPILFGTNGRFLFNYGAELFIDGSKNESIIILERAKKMISHSDLYLYLGKNFEELGNFEKARENYIIASNISPSKFVPMETLLNLYITSGRSEEAKKQAMKIVAYPVKVESEKQRLIKLRARQFLDKMARN